MSLRILVITPKMPFPKTGACEQDRGYGIEDLIRLGYEVRVIAKTSADKLPRAAEESKRLGIPLVALPYVHSTFGAKGLLGALRRLFSPWTWDGAANEYYDPAIRAEVRRTIEAFKPDLVWFDYTYLWPLYGMIREKGIPIVTRSINFEPTHFLQEDGMSLVNLLKFLPKLMSECITLRKSDLMLSITVHEEKIYARFSRHVRNLPLRGLPHLLVESRIVREHAEDGTDPLHVFFFGSTYNVHHNRHALEFLLKDVFPRVEKQAPGAFRFHILGAKIPADLESLCVDPVTYEGYVADLDEFFKGVDIAVIPSLMGAGMQQKMFEPLARGIPTVASPRGIADYPFASGQEYIGAVAADEFAAAIISLRDVGLRRKLSVNSLKRSQEIFSQDVIDAIVSGAIRDAVGAAQRR